MNVKTYSMEDLEWCGGRMAHLRLRRDRGGERGSTICGADPKDFMSLRDPIFGRPTITAEEAAEMHKCKSCLKRVQDPSGT